MERIVFLERDSLQANVRRPSFAHSWDEHHGIPGPEEVVRCLRDATIAVVNKARIRAESLASLPQLRMIAVAATGTPTRIVTMAMKGRRVRRPHIRNAGAATKIATMKPR